MYGAPRIHAELRMEHEIRVGRKRVARLMKAAGISGVRPRKRWKTTIRIPGITPATDLVERHFRPDRPERAVGRGHHLPAHRRGLAVPRRRPGRLLPADRRLVDGHPHAREPGRRRAQDGARAPAPDPGLIHHSDQGSQYVSLAFGRAAGEAGIAVSMGSRGDAYDNAVAETFFATLKKELVNRRSWPSRLELQSAVFEYIEAFYNRQRRHSTLGMLSPVAYEQLRLSPLGG